MTTEDPRVQVDSYVVRPTGYDELAHDDKDSWCLYVANGNGWGWSVRRRPNGDSALNRSGQWIGELAGSGHNKARRFGVDEALDLALQYVDVLKINGCTASQASAAVAARHATVPGPVTG